MTPIGQRLVNGLLWGLAFSAVCSVVGAVGAIAPGSEFTQRYHVGLAGLVALYFVCGAVGGLTYGLLKPLGSTLLGASALGLLVGLPIGFVITAVVCPGLPVTSGEFLFVWLGGAFCLGPFVGAGLYIRIGGGRSP